MIATVSDREAIVNSQTLIIVAAIVVAIVIAAVAWTYSQRQRRVHLRERFGPEYDRAVHEAGAPAKAEAILEDRARRVERLKIRTLSQEQADSFAREWRQIQAQFVDDPNGAVAAADHLVAQVMAARGYPLDDFETRAADLSVDHPRVVENYRTARAIALRRERGEAETEELRQAVVNYRALFEDLLEVDARNVRRRAS
jgi:FtsZ-interacting cell division protein ZipA